MRSFDYTVQLERALLKQLISSMMMARMYVHRVSEGMFTSNERRFIFEVVQRTMEETRSMVTKMVFEYEVKSRVAEQDVAYYLSEWNLVEGMGEDEPPEVLIERINEANVGRTTLTVVEEVTGMLERGEIGEAVAHMQRQSMTLATRKDERPLVELTDYQRRIDLIMEKRAHPEKYLGCKIGFKTFDGHTGGLYKGELTLIAGVTGVGKSTLCRQLAKNIVILNPGRNVLHVANEEYLEQVEHKYDALWSAVPYNDFKQAKITDEDMQRWQDKMEELKTEKFGRIFVKEVPAFSNVTLIEKAYRELENLGIVVDVIIIDHLPHVMPVQKSWGENDERAKAASECKELARWLKVAVVVPSQAATEVEAKQTKGRRAGKLDVYGSKGQIHVANTFIIITSKGTDDTQADMKDYLRDVYWLMDVKKNRDGPPFYFLAKHYVKIGVVEEIDEVQQEQSKDGKDAARAVVAEGLEGHVREQATKAMEAVDGGADVDAEEPQTEAQKLRVDGNVDDILKEAGVESPTKVAASRPKTLLEKIRAVRKVVTNQTV